jgi:predicted metalloprotease
VVIALCATLLCGGCGSSGESDTSTTAREQGKQDRLVNEAAPFEAARQSKAVLAQVVQDDSQTVGQLRELLRAAAQEIGGFWAVEVPKFYGQSYEGPRYVAGVDPGAGQVVCGGNPTPIEGNAFFCRPDNFIAWDEPTLMLPLFKGSPLAPVFVLAHEWGHSIQEQLQVPYQHTIDSELDADCLAGVWAADAFRRGKLSREDFDRAVDVLHDFQDADGVPWTDAQAHGTAFERIRAFGHGVDGGPFGCIRPA